jgi:hypothetical protein
MPDPLTEAELAVQRQRAVDAINELQRHAGGATFRVLREALWRIEKVQVPTEGDGESWP